MNTNPEHSIVISPIGSFGSEITEPVINEIIRVFGLPALIIPTLENVDFAFNPFLARGLDYYTSTVFELKLNKTEKLTIGAGGRYDNLIGMFAGRDIPAVGFSFGIDRIIDLLP